MTTFYDLKSTKYSDSPSTIVTANSSAAVTSNTPIATCTSSAMASELRTVQSNVLPRPANSHVSHEACPRISTRFLNSPEAVNLSTVVTEIQIDKASIQRLKPQIKAVAAPPLLTKSMRRRLKNKIKRNDAQKIIKRYKDSDQYLRDLEKYGNPIYVPYPVPVASFQTAKSRRRKKYKQAKKEKIQREKNENDFKVIDFVNKDLVQNLNPKGKSAFALPTHISGNNRVTREQSPVSLNKIVDMPNVRENESLFHKVDDHSSRSFLNAVSHGKRKKYTDEPVINAKRIKLSCPTQMNTNTDLSEGQESVVSSENVQGKNSTDLDCVNAMESKKSFQLSSTCYSLRLSTVNSHSVLPSTSSLLSGFSKSPSPVNNCYPNKKKSPEKSKIESSLPSMDRNVHKQEKNVKTVTFLDNVSCIKYSRSFLSSSGNVESNAEMHSKGFNTSDSVSTVDSSSSGDCVANTTFIADSDNSSEVYHSALDVVNISSIPNTVTSSVVSDSTSTLSDSKSHCALPNTEDENLANSMNFAI